ncbi:MAG: hypothetical protein Q9164_004931 [Protoblastenia rupestris]
MSDREFGGNDDLSLPKATVQKIISEILTTPSLNTAPDSSVTFARDARELLIECCVEFVTLISSEANEIAEKEQKKTIAIEHIDKALRELGFPEYVKEVLASAGDAKEMLKVDLPGGGLYRRIMLTCWICVDEGEEDK